MIRVNRGLWDRKATNYPSASFFSRFTRRLNDRETSKATNSASAAELNAAAVRVSQQGDYHVITLRGAWTQANIAPLRECFALAAQANQDVRLELGEVTYIDSAFLGLVTLLYGHQKQQRKMFLIN